MKKLFYLLLALPLVFAACEPDTPEQKVEKEAVLTLTSEATMSFGAEGGEGVITYTAELKDVTRNSPVPEPVVEAACEADWVTDLTVAENITFTVLGLLVKIVDKIGAVSVYWSKLVDKCGCLPAFSTCI